MSFGVKPIAGSINDCATVLKDAGHLIRSEIIPFKVGNHRAIGPHLPKIQISFYPSGTGARV